MSKTPPVTGPSGARRHFLLQQLPLAAISLVALAQAAEAPKPVAEDDPEAVKLGYKADAAKVSKKEAPSFEDGQNCMGCSLFNRISGTAFGKCEALAMRPVAEAGWCKAFVPAM
jgi:hypothetical protein